MSKIQKRQFYSGLAFAYFNRAEVYRNCSKMHGVPDETRKLMRVLMRDNALEAVILARGNQN